MDVVWSVPGGMCQFFVDATMRCPHAVRSEHGSRAAALAPLLPSHYQASDLLADRQLPRT